MYQETRPHLEPPILWPIVEATVRSVERLWLLYSLMHLVVAFETLLVAYVLVVFCHHGPEPARALREEAYPAVRPSVAPAAAGGFVPATGTLTPPAVVPSAGTLNPPRVPAAGTLGPPTAIGGGGLPGLPPRVTGTP
jgi:hypothetical protein